MSNIAFMDTSEKTLWRRYTPRQIQVLKEVKEKKRIYPYGLSKEGHPYSSVQRIVEGFVKEDLLSRIAGRPITYELTPEGERLVEECQDIFFVDQKGIHGDPLVGMKGIHSNCLPSRRSEDFRYKLQHLQGSPVDLALVGQQIATHRDSVCVKNLTHGNLLRYIGVPTGASISPASLRISVDPQARIPLGRSAFEPNRPVLFEIIL